MAQELTNLSTGKRGEIALTYLSTGMRGEVPVGVTTVSLAGVWGLEAVLSAVYCSESSGQLKASLVRVYTLMESTIVMPAGSVPAPTITQPYTTHVDT